MQKEELISEGINTDFGISGNKELGANSITSVCSVFSLSFFLLRNFLPLPCSLLDGNLFHSAGRCCHSLRTATNKPVANSRPTLNASEQGALLKRRAMKNKSISTMLAVLCLTLVFGAAAAGQARKNTSNQNIKDESSQSDKAARVFKEIMNTPDKGIPRELIERAECVFIIGGRGGRGVASCRTARGWSAPAFFNLGGGSFGLQIGAQSTDFVMLFMNKDGLNSLLSDGFTVGGDASVAAGPVGRQAGASTDIKLNAQILSYSRSKGLFAGLELKGVVIKPDKDDMRDVYGAGVTAKEVLQDNKVTAPFTVRAFPTTLGKYSSRMAEK
jgi:SH3 domain-containing YSC84-like protein 1